MHIILWVNRNFDKGKGTFLCYKHIVYKIFYFIAVSCEINKLQKKSCEKNEIC